MKNIIKKLIPFGLLGICMLIVPIVLDLEWQYKTVYILAGIYALYTAYKR